MADAGEPHFDSSDPWMSDYAERVRAFVGQSFETNARIAEKWRAKALSEDEWTVDTVTADAIEAWEELTPMTGEALELWLEMVQRMIRRGR